MSGRSRRALAAFVAVLSGATAGCLGRSPEVHFYSMSAVPGTPVSGTSQLAVGVGPARVPRYLDRPQIVTRSGASRLEFDELNRWAGDFSSNVLRTLGDDLGSRLGTQRVVVYPSDPPFALDYRVSLDFFQFEAQKDGELVLRARWAIRGSGDAGPWSGETSLRRPLEGRGVEELVAAHDDAVGALADQIAAHLARLGG